MKIIWKVKDLGVTILTLWQITMFKPVVARYSPISPNLIQLNPPQPDLGQLSSACIF